VEVVQLDYDVLPVPIEVVDDDNDDHDGVAPYNELHLL